MKVWEIIQQKGRQVHTVKPRESVADAIRHFVELNVRALVVAENSSVAGILTIRDVLNHIAQKGSAAVEDAVDQVMTRDVTSVGPEARLEDVETLFAENEFNHIPVLENSKLVGVLTPADVFASHLQDVQEVNERLLKYISGGYS